MIVSREFEFIYPECRVTLSQHEIKMNPFTVPTHILDLFVNDSLEQDVLQ